MLECLLVLRALGVGVALVALVAVTTTTTVVINLNTKMILAIHRLATTLNSILSSVVLSSLRKPAGLKS